MEGDQEEEEECSYITFTTTEGRCDALFDRGVEMVAQGDPTSALSFFLETLTVLQDCQYANKLLPTLYQLAEIYRVVGEVEKSQEIASSVSMMQEALDKAMREKWKERKRLGRSGLMSFQRQQQEDQQQTDCGALFLTKVEECCNEIDETQNNSNTDCAIQLSENVFRILQFVFGPQHPRTLQSLRALTKLYTSDTDSDLELTECLEPIIFTATIKSLCTQISEQRENQESNSTPPLTESGVTLTHSSICKSIAPSPICNSSEDLVSSSEEEEASLHLLQCCLVEEKGSPSIPLPVVRSPPKMETTSTTMVQDVYPTSLQHQVHSPSTSGGDKNQSEFQVCSNSSSHCGGVLNSHKIVISLSLCQSNRASLLTLLLAFGLMAVAAALSVY